jgi:hypothetical protein
LLIRLGLSPKEILIDMYRKIFSKLQSIQGPLIISGTLIFIVFTYGDPSKFWKKLSCATGFTQCLRFNGAKFHPDDVMEIGWICDDRNHYSSSFILTDLENRIGYRATYKPKNYKKTAEKTTKQHNAILDRHRKKEIATVCRDFDHAARQDYNWTK